MPNVIKSQVFAQGRVSSAGAILNSGTNNWSAVRNAAGVYTISWLGSQIDPANALYKVWPRSGAAALQTTAKVSNDAAEVIDASFVVRTFDAAGAAADVEFDFEVSLTQ